MSLEDLGWSKWDQTKEQGKWRQNLRDIAKKYVVHYTGPTYHEVVSACLDVEVPAEANDQQVEMAGKTPQQAVMLDIIRKLDTISV